MKKWISRLLSGADNAANAPDDDADDVDQERQDELVSSEIDAVYYRWLTGTAGFNAPADLESLILDRVHALIELPDSAAELVPRVPDMIPQLLRSLNDDDVSISELSRQVVQDVVLVAEVMREANSAYYRPASPIETVEPALMMLGQNGLRMLLARIAFRPVIKMQTDGFSRHVAPQVWKQSEKCALAASMVAPGLIAGTFESYLAGLMQNVGLVVAFRLADQVCPNGSIPYSSEFGVKLLASSRLLSAGIAKHWDFPLAVTDAIAQAGHPGDSGPARALAQGDRIAKLSLLLDAGMVSEDDTLVSDGLDSFQRRCLGKLSNLES